MTPLPTNPTVVVLLNPEGKLEAYATNVAMDLEVKVATTLDEYRELALGKTFDTARN